VVVAEIHGQQKRQLLPSAVIGKSTWAIINMDIETLKTLLNPSGKLAPQPATDWQGDIPLPFPLADFYANVGPLGEVYYENVGPVGLTFNVGGNPVCMPPLTKLWKLQEGYRWDGNTGERINNWPNNWLVIAEQGGDPFILDTQNNVVYFAFHGAGAWAPNAFAPNIETAIGAIATVANTLSSFDEEEAFDEQTYELKPEVRTAVLHALTQFLGNNQAEAKRMLDVWQWYQ
jgi:hypothetical protein